MSISKPSDAKHGGHGPTALSAWVPGSSTIKGRPTPRAQDRISSLKRTAWRIPRISHAFFGDLVLLFDPF